MTSIPLPDKTDLFRAGGEGCRQYRIPGIVVTGNGVVLAYCEARKGQLGDWGKIDLAFRRSLDGAKTWEQIRHFHHPLTAEPLNPYAPQRHDPSTAADLTLNNPVAILGAQPGVVHFLYCVDYARCFVMRSEDDGASFSEPVEITSAFEAFRAVTPWKVIAVGPGHGVALRNGRLVVPVWFSPAGEKGHEHAPNTVSVIYSDDDGATWQAGDVVRPIAGDGWNLNETCVVELTDGTVLLNMRNHRPGNRRLVSISPDGAKGWTEPEFREELWEPVCMGGTVRLSAQPGQTRNRILYSAPTGRRPRPNREHIMVRENLGIYLSYDEGRTWPVCRQLENGPSGYSDLAVLPDGTCLCFYERDNEEGVYVLTMARFGLDWLTDGADVLDSSAPSSRSEVGRALASRSAPR